MEAHIGHLIRKKLEESGMSKAEFGRRIGITRQNVQHLLSRDSQDTELLFQISKVLKYDFFQYYSRALNAEPVPAPATTVAVKGKKADSDTEQRIDGLKKELDQLRKDMQLLLRLVENRNEARKRRG